MTKTENQLVNHSLEMENQTKLKITGVIEVVSATDKGVLCKLANSHLQILGDNIRVEKLSPEDKILVVTGLINGIKYSGGQKDNNIFKKLFR